MTEPQPHLIEAESHGWRTPVVITRIGLLIYSLVIGLAIAGIIVIGALYLHDRRARTSDALKANQAANAANHQAIKRLDALTAELQRLTNPTPQQYREALKEGIKRCLQEPECRKLFPNITEQSTGGGNP